MELLESFGSETTGIKGGDVLDQGAPLVPLTFSVCILQDCIHSNSDQASNAGFTHQDVILQPEDIFQSPLAPSTPRKFMTWFWLNHIPKALSSPSYLSPRTSHFHFPLTSMFIERFSPGSHQLQKLFTGLSRSKLCIWCASVVQPQYLPLEMNI